MALWSSLAALVVLNPDDLLDFGKSLIAMSAFVSNLYFISQTQLGGYFGYQLAKEPLLHTWSLSVEEQFYIFFPVMLVALQPWNGKWRTLVLICISAASLALSVVGSVNDAAVAFFSLSPRVWEFLCGALLATGALPPLKHRFVREFAGILGLALVGYAIKTFDKSTPFPALNALFPCIGAAVLIYSGAGGTTYARTLLSFPPLVFIGAISYSLYLWHWPIFVFAKLFLVRPLDKLETVAALAASLLAAFLSFELVEHPFRRRPSSIGRKQIFGFAVVGVMISIFIGSVLVETGGLPQRYDLKTREIVSQNLERKKDRFPDCVNWQAEIHQISDIDFCEFGRARSGNVMFWGDSILATLGKTIKEMQSEGSLADRGVILAIEPGCPVVPNLNWMQASLHCDDFNKFASARAHAEDIGTVFLVFSTWWVTTDDMCVTSNGQCLRKLRKSEASGYLLENLRSMIQELRVNGKRVVLALPFPNYGRSVPDIEIHNALFAKAFGKIVPAEEPLGDIRNQLISVGREAGADIFDPRSRLCNEQGCTYEVDGVSIYLNKDHIAPSQAGIFKADLIRILSAHSRAE